MLAPFLRGVKDLAGMTRTTGRVTGSLLSAPLREGNPVGAFVRANPFRSGKIAIGGALTIGGAGLAGFGPGSFIGEETGRYITSKYGDTEQSRNIITQTKLFGGATAAVGLGFIGSGIIGKEPNLLDKVTNMNLKVDKALTKIGSISANFGDTSKKALSYISGFTKGIFATSGELENLILKRKSYLQNQASSIIQNVQQPVRDQNTGKLTQSFRDFKRKRKAARKEARRIYENDAEMIGTKHAKKIVDFIEQPPLSMKRSDLINTKRRNARIKKGFENAAKGFGDLLNLKPIDNLFDFATNYKQTSNKFPDTIFKAYVGFENAAKGFGNALGAPVGFAKKHPFMTASAAGFAAGGAAGMLTADIEKDSMGGFEGNIIDMGASSGGSISPELQFSTQGLVFALHKNNKNSRSRYQ